MSYYTEDLAFSLYRRRMVERWPESASRRATLEAIDGRIAGLQALVK